MRNRGRGPRGSAAAAVFLPVLCAQPVIRVETREVIIDATVTARKGASGDLTAADFTVWEDGKPQKITGFTRVADDPESSQKHFVLYFDWTAMPIQDQSSSLRAASTFVDGMASPDRHMAIAALTPAGPHVHQNFTNSKAALRKALEIPFTPTTPTAATALAVYQSSEQVRTAGTGRPPINPGQAVGVWTPASPDGFSRFMDSLRAAAESLAPAQGRKALLLFTGGWAIDSSNRALKDAIVALNRADVAVYVVATVRSNAGGAGDFPRLLADGTGGEVVRLGANIADELARVARQQDESYRLAYVPPESEPGSCHKLRVKVNVKGAEVRARNEYCASKPVDLVAGKIAGERLESRMGGANLTASMQLPYFYTGTNRANVRLTLEVVPANMRFQKEKDKLHGQIDLVGTAVRPDGGIAARFADTVDIDRENQRQADAFTHEPYRYENQFLLPAGKYTFRMMIGAGPDAAEQVEAPLEVDPWNSAQLGIGGIAFSKEAHPAGDGGAAPVLEGRGPLVAGGVRFVPCASARFRRSEHAWFYTEIYDPLLAGANPPAVQVRMRIVDRKTGEVKVDTGTAGAASYVREGNPVVPFATALPMANLPAGTFRLEVTAGDSSGAATVARSIDFEVVE